MTLCDKLLPQAELCLNHLLSYNPNPSISAYEGLHGCQFDFRAHPIAPAGAKVIIHDKPTGRSSWAPHDVLGFYLGPAKKQYRCFNVRSVDTQTDRVTDTLAWLFDKLSLPNIGPHEIALAAIKDLTEALTSLAKAHPSTAHLRRLSDPPTTILSDLTAFVKSFYPGNTSSVTPIHTADLQNSPLPSCNQPHQIEPAPTEQRVGAPSIESSDYAPQSALQTLVAILEDQSPLCGLTRSQGAGTEDWELGQEERCAGSGAKG